MAAISVPTLIAVGLITGAGVAVNVHQQEKVAEAQEEASDLERAIGNAKAAKERRAQASKAQVARAEVENQAAAGGATLSSAAIVGGQGITSQATENIADINRAQDFEGARGRKRQNVVDAGQDSLGTALVKQAGNIAAPALGQAAGSAIVI